MPRKPKSLDKQNVTIVIDGKPFVAVLHPPTKSRASWYAYWHGLVTSRSTGQASLEDAIGVVEGMFRNWREGGQGNRPVAADGTISDDEFVAIQIAHFERRHDPAANARAAKTLADCLHAISAFQAIVRMPSIGFNRPISLATADICAGFQRLAVTLPRNWRKRYAKSKAADQVARIRANTVAKWSRALQAAFQRANRNAGKKCVRGIVSNDKLLVENPWMQFTWLDGEEKQLRQYDSDELLGLLDWIDARWPGVTAASALAKILIWSQCRRTEAVSLTWKQLRTIGSEHHFAVVGKAGIEKWFRVPHDLYQDLLAIKTTDPHVFAAYTQQLAAFYARSMHPGKERMVCKDFNPINLGDWFHAQIAEWSKNLPNGPATIHVFRKTGLQYALDGESASRKVAADARLTDTVLMKNYAKTKDPQRRRQSNRTFRRIAAAINPEVSARYGFKIAALDPLEEKLRLATEKKNWTLVGRLSVALSARRSAATKNQAGSCEIL
jgi:integrase